MTKADGNGAARDVDLGQVVARLEAATMRIQGSRLGVNRHYAELCVELVRVQDEKLHQAVGLSFDEWADQALDLSRSMIKLLVRVGRSFTREQIETYGVTKLNLALTYQAVKSKLGEPVADLSRERITVTERNDSEVTKPLLEASSRQIAAATRALRKRLVVEQEQGRPGKKKADQLAECMNAKASAKGSPLGDNIKCKADWVERNDAYFLQIKGVCPDKVPLTLRALANAVEEMANDPSKRSDSDNLGT